MPKPLNEYSKEELIELVKCQKNTIQQTKKFGLVWEDKPEKVATDCEKKLPVIKEVPDKAIKMAGDTEPTNIIIEGDNYHALSALNYTHAGKIDVIYIDPPYNTGAKDWKYNNNYVDENDAYRHSKWLSMMEKRLKLAKNLLNPEKSTLICTIDEKEYLHLGCMLEQIFPDAKIQMIDIVINLSGTGRKNEFTRTNEFAFFVTVGSAKILPVPDVVDKKKITWAHLHRSEITNNRQKTKAQFYPIFVNDKTKTIEMVGEPLAQDVDRNSVVAPSGCTAVFPVRDDDIETMWGCTPEELKNRIKKGYVRVGKYQPNLPQKYAIGYLKSGVIKDIEDGVATTLGYDDRGAIIAEYNNASKKKMPTTVMTKNLYDANRYGTKFITMMLGPGKFTYPKSLYAVKDCIQFVANDRNEITVLDFFAGSGTTLHAVNLLNAEDGGKRKCIIVTNNEVSEQEAVDLKARGYRPGDIEWEKHGIAQAVTWPRTKCSILGKDINGNELDGAYEESGIPFKDGLRSNVRYFKTVFVDKCETLDRLRRELCPACEDMIRVREGAFEKVIDKDMLKVYKNSRGLTAIIYDRFELAQYVEEIEKLDTDTPIHLYVFSYSKSNRFDEMPANLKHKYESQPIPDGVLEIYKKIFANAKGGNKQCSI